MKSRMLVFILIFHFVFLMPMKIMAISAESYCVVDGETGSILKAHNANIRMGLASTTKIMTALLALESGKSEEIATVSSNAAGTIGSSLYLKPGEKIKVYDLVCGLMLNSGNDAAIVLAEHIGGNVENFVHMMNMKAIEIGAQQTHFSNPNGLSDEEHYTTAADLARITVHALKNNAFKKIVTIKEMRIETVGEDKRSIYLHNHNKLLATLEGCDGVKTGFTKATGRCLVSSVTRCGMQTVCVTLNAGDDWNDHKVLHDEAHAMYEKQVWIENGTDTGSIAVLNGVEKEVRSIAAQTLSGIVQKNNGGSVQLEIDLIQNLMAPVLRGQIVGKLTVYINGEQKGDTDLIAASSVDALPSVTFWDIFKKIYNHMF